MTLTTKIKPYNPKPNQNDIKNGVMYRFFASRANQVKNNVVEIDRREYDRLRSKRSIVVERIKWKITGDLEDRSLVIDVVGIKEEVRIPGVLTQNSASVRLASRNIPFLSRYLKNLQEFYQG